jgi:hypothetical protein
MSRSSIEAEEMNIRALKVVATIVLGASTLAPAFAQGTTTLRNPLIPGAQSTAPGMPAALGAPPPVGSGPTPIPVTRGMSGPPTLPPWIVNGPSDDIDVRNSHVNLPVNNSVLAPPGYLGPALAGYVPGAPSTPGLVTGATPGLVQSGSQARATTNSSSRYGQSLRHGLSLLFGGRNH